VKNRCPREGRYQISDVTDISNGSDTTANYVTAVIGGRTMIISVNDLVRIAGAGAGFTIDAASYEAGDLVKVAGAAVAGKSRIHILNAKRLPVHDLCHIANMGEGSVTFDLT
jgi:hypothetical protein